MINELMFILAKHIKKAANHRLDLLLYERNALRVLSDYLREVTATPT